MVFVIPAEVESTNPGRDSGVLQDIMSGDRIIARPPRHEKGSFLRARTEQRHDLLLGAFKSSPVSNVSSILLHSTRRHGAGQVTQGRLVRFLPFSSPKLSKLDIDNFQPDSSSPFSQPPISLH